MTLRHAPEQGPACSQVYLLVANPWLPKQQYWVWVLADSGAADVAVTLSATSSAAALGRTFLYVEAPRAVHSHCACMLSQDKQGGKGACIHTCAEPGML